MSVLQLEDEVNHKVYADWVIGKVTRVSEDNTYAVVWEGDFSACHHEGRELIPAPGGDTESPDLGEEETMERLYEVEQSVSDAGGNLGLIEDFDIRENGVFYKVIWEDSRETWNVQGAIKPVRELKSTPTPKEVRDVVEAVVHPPHYGGGDNPYEAIKVIEAWDLGFALGNVVKYVSRAGKKDKTKELEDLQKAAFYLNRRIETLESK